MLPWVVGPEHRMAWDARMLRLEGRRRKGGRLSEEELRWLTQWKDQLTERNAVIDYVPGSCEGFVWTERLDTDDDIVRRPRD